MKNEKAKVLTGYRKAQGLLGKIIGMLEADAYCVDVMEQNLAVMGLLKSAHKHLMEQHLHSCFLHAMETGSAKKKAEMIDEIITVSHLANK